MSELQLLSNGSYHVLLTPAGHGFSCWGDMAITRWRADATFDDGGARCYVLDHTSQSAGFPAKQQEPGSSSVLHHRHEIDFQIVMAVSFDDAMELRRVVISNNGNQRRELSATSYAEIVLTRNATDSAHLAFSKLFIETEVETELQAILATRRPSASDDPAPWFFHTVMINGSTTGSLTFETDRMRFLGRGRDAGNPQALVDGAGLSGSTGPVLDAVAAIRVPFVLEPGNSITIDWLTGVSATRQSCAALLRKVRDPGVVTQILQQGGEYQRKLLLALAISDSDALIFQRMAASLVYAASRFRADAGVIEQNRRGQSSLWGFGISGDLPIVLLCLSGPEWSTIAKQMAHCHAYWNAFGLRCELAVLCAESPDGKPRLFDQVRQQMDAEIEPGRIGKPGGIFVLDDNVLDTGDRILLQSVARIVLTDAQTLAEQLPASARYAAPIAIKKPDAVPTGKVAQRAAPLNLLDANGFGGFSPDGREYVITTSAARMTPAPWVNVIANPEFGTLVSESGSATTWSENAHEFRLTPWSNDPVSDPNMEAFYIRDEASGLFWSPTVLPTRAAGDYTTRHGFGYSTFEHTQSGIDSELRLYVAIDSPVKFSVLRLCNQSDQPRKLSVIGYVEWVLGDERAKTQMQVVTERDVATGALFARNGYNTDFARRTAFFDADNAATDICCDRADFFGPNGSLSAPAALTHIERSGRIGAALDPCAALRVSVDLAPGQTQYAVFRLGAGKTVEEARELVLHWRRPGAADDVLDAVHAFWRQTLGAVQIHTPDAALDRLSNGWLVYQVIASRLWGRTAFYQSSGAFGFRDQLQDVMALVHAAPALVREHLLRAASRQFIEGDVQHWWHPPSGKGVRTRCADDFLWLPLVICRYTEVTGDFDILDVACPFLDSRALKDGEASNYELPKVADEVASLYEHGVRAIRHGLVWGEHGLPLMGSGDWNDGMNLVGAEGKGESVWMAFFLVTVLARFAPLARARGDTEFADLCHFEAKRLGASVEASAWDGAWYRRAWFDDGTVLGSAANTECQMDSIAQSWSVLSGAAPADHAQLAMASLYERLVHSDTHIVQLLDPPFDTSKPSPGYIQGYVPGVRENGGQYTHAAMWAAMAFAALGDTDRAWELCAMLNPLLHAKDAAEVAQYRVEPYVLAGDVYAFEPHTGRGGWTWYTGSAGWMLQLINESLLGLKRSGNQLHVQPLIPKTWTCFNVSYRFGASTYAITCREAAAGTVAGVVINGIATPGNTVTLIDDGQTHVVLIDVVRN